MSRTRCSALRGAPQSRDPESKPRMDPGSAAQRWRATQHPGNARDAACQIATQEQAMQVNPYLFFNGNCEAALKFYQKVLGAKIEAILTYEGGPAEMPIPPDYRNKVMHAKVTIDGE